MGQRASVPGGEPAQLQGLLGLCVRAGGAGWGAEGGPGRAQSVPGVGSAGVRGRARLQRPLVCQDGLGGGLLDMQARGTGEMNECSKPQGLKRGEVPR